MKKKQCPKCGKILPVYKFGMRKQKRWIKTQQQFRTYYHLQSYCTECRHAQTDPPRPITACEDE